MSCAAHQRLEARHRRPCWACCLEQDLQRDNASALLQVRIIDPTTPNAGALRTASVSLTRRQVETAGAIDIIAAEVAKRLRQLLKVEDS